jgi:hypothetical protein
MPGLGAVFAGKSNVLMLALVTLEKNYVPGSFTGVSLQPPPSQLLFKKVAARSHGFGMQPD